MAVDKLALGFGIAAGVTLLYALYATSELKKLKPPATGPGFFEKIRAFLTPASDYITTWFSLFPYVFFFAGFIIDIINSQFMYSKASVVGLISVLVIGFLGSDRFAKQASNLHNWIGPMYTPPLGALPSGVSYSWYEYISFKSIFINIAILLGIFSFMIGGQLAFGQLPNWAWQSTVTAAALFVTSIAASNDWLGDLNPAATVPTDSSSTLEGVISVSDVCSTPGLACVQTRFAPVGILLTTSILSSHFFEAFQTGNTQTQTAIGGIIAGSFLFEWFTLYMKGCADKYKYKHLAPLISLALGMGAGAAGYYAMKESNQESFTSSSSDGGVFHPPPAPEKQKKSDSEKLSTKVVVGPQPDTSEPVNEDQDAFVCEAYKDGELITSTIVE